MVSTHADALFNVVTGDTCRLRVKESAAIHDKKILTDCIDREQTNRGANDEIDEYTWTFEIRNDVRSDYDLRGDLIHIRIRHFPQKDSEYHFPALIISGDDQTDEKESLFVSEVDIVDE